MVTSLRQTPFEVPPFAKPVSDPQLTYADLNAALNHVDGTGIVMFVRSYIQERTPAAFASRPMLWEAVREWLGARLGVHPREIGLSGSAQTGFSMNSARAGEPFDPGRSDLDLYAVNEMLFGKMKTEALRFIARNPPGARLQYQAETVSRQIGMGFIDLIQVPANHEAYPIIATALNDASILVDRLKQHTFVVQPSHIRVYENWRALGRWVTRSYRPARAAAS